MCQYKCSYCYARKQYRGKWGVPGIWSKQLRVIDELSKSTLPVFLGLLGGEPTMHQRYFGLLDIIQENIMTHEMSRLYITTNGAKNSEFFMKHKDVDGRVFLLWSVHPEFVDFENFYNNIVLMGKKGYRNKVNLMLHPNKKYWTMTKEWYHRLDELGVILHPHFIYDGINKDVDYNKEFYEFFKFLENQREKEFVFGNGVEDIYKSDYEIFSQGLNRFEGWNCWQNNFEIMANGQILNQCFDDYHTDIPVDFFKGIKNIKPRVCPHEFCSCDGLMKIYKEKC